MQAEVEVFGEKLNLKNKGVDFVVRDNDGKLVGRITVNRAGICVRTGKTGTKNGDKYKWKELFITE